MRVLLLIPHPDDEVVAAATLIVRARARGDLVFGAYLTEGVPPREALWPWARSGREARVATRWAEAEAVARRLELVRALAQPIPSRTLRLHLEQTYARLFDLVVAHEIDAIWTPTYEGGHQDHDATCALASRLATSDQLFAARGRRLEVKELAEYNFADGRVHTNELPFPNGREETHVLDAEARAWKRSLLELYASEANNLRHVGTEREVIRPLARHDFARPPHDGPLFYQRFAWARFHPRVDGTTPEEVSRAITTFLASPVRA